MPPMAMQNVRGTHDLLPAEMARHRLIIDAAKEEVLKDGFEEMATPILEFSEVFKRTLGDASDIVAKEMYSFLDRGGEELVLRPEGTAGIARAFLSQGLTQNLPLKFFYHGPMFRYERPQKGRQRQFHQIGVELLGVAGNWADIECIAAGDRVLKRLDVRNLCTLEVNSIGDQESRSAYRDQLVAYLTKFSAELCADSQKRLVTNPLRILDSKDASDQKILEGAPKLEHSLNDASKKRIEEVLETLTKFGVEFTVNPLLVRGLDYYSHIVFEFKTTALGAQDAVLSGGRYDTLIETMGGNSTPGVGWAAGVERLSMLSPLKPTKPEWISVVPIHADAEGASFELAHKLRSQGFFVDISYSGNVSKRMKKANQKGSKLAILLGPDELASGTCQLKNLGDGTQRSVALSDLNDALK